MGMDLEGFETIFGEAKPELEPSAAGHGDVHVLTTTLKPFLFRVFADDPSHLLFHATDFHSNTWESRRSVHQLDDLRDSIGISGSWSDFVNYVTASLKSKDVKLVMDWKPKFNGVTSAKLVARKSKGMPLMSISLTKLGPPAATEAVANLSMELYRAYKMLQDSLVKEKECCGQPTHVKSAEKLENQRQLKTSNSGNLVSQLDSDTSSVTAALNSTDKQPASEVQPTKVAQRVVPAYRRAKVRGVVLRDTEDD